MQLKSPMFVTEEASPRYYVVDNFFPEAVTLRRHFDIHFAEPERHGPRHQIWDYWHVPNLYTYLRTNPRNVLPASLFERLLAALDVWSLERLGCALVSEPYLSLYIDGCGQGLHNDAENGRWGFVFSLTDWDGRVFDGGETILFREMNYWGTEACSKATAGNGFYDLVAPMFNRLLVFDDRIIHGVEPLRGPVQPLKGRVVLHGHLRERPLLARGSLREPEALPIVGVASSWYRACVARFVDTWVGALTMRVSVAAGGFVTSINVLSDLLTPRTSPVTSSPREEILTELQRLRFPVRPGPTELVVSLTLPS